MTARFLLLCIFVTCIPCVGVSESRKQSLKPNHFSILCITIGKDNLKTLETKLGAVQKCGGTEHDGVDIAGYTISGKKLVFEFGKLGGGDVTGFYVSSLPAAPDCPLSQLPPRISKLATDAGVRLGMTEKDFKRLFGSPKNLVGGLWNYDWTYEEKYSEDDKRKAADAGYTVGNTYLVGITIQARFNKRALQYFYISKLETT